MDWQTILTFIYSLVPMIGVSAYVPQIITLWKSKKKLENFQFATWSLWLFAASISVMYGVFKLQDLMFTITSLANAIPLAIVIVLACKRSGMSLNGAALKINARINPDIDQIADQMHDQGYEGEYVQGSKHNWIVTVDHAFIAQEPQTIQ